MRLAVELHGVKLGTLEGDARSFDFLPDSEAIRSFGVNSRALSVAIPLTPAPRRDQATRRRNWFAELLPEGDQYHHMLAQAGLRPGDTLRFLARYGRDVAGALQIWDLDDPTEPPTPSLRSLNDAQVRVLLTDPIGAPLANDLYSGKSSLGGVQPKIVLVRSGDGWAQSLGGYPTTHILKPQLTGHLSSVVFDEEYGSRIARALGLSSGLAQLQKFDGLTALVIERYDRDQGARLHQEDFNQVLGARGDQKYQRIGGVVSLRRVAGALRLHATQQELVRLARMVVLAVAIGNLDLHTKNLSLLHVGNDRVQLAPAYDVVPQAHMLNDGEVALAVNGKYRHASIERADLVTEIQGWGLRKAGILVDDALAEIESAVMKEEPTEGAFPELRRQVLGFTRALQRQHP